MPSLDNNKKAFLELVRSGLWEKEARFSQFGEVDYDELMCLAEEQSVDGLVTAGLEHVQDVKVPQEVLLQFIGTSLQIEQRNREMNKFIAGAVEAMRDANINCLVVKGSGLAQCYSRPLWRTCGDVDFFFSEAEYNRAVELFTNQEGARIVQNAQYTKSLGIVIEPWFLELHGTLRNGLSSKMDKEIDAVQKELFSGDNVRSWQNGETLIFLPSPSYDVFLVFVHFVRHFYKEGVCLRQLCDWCRLLCTYKERVDTKFLESRIRRSGLMHEWWAFSALAVDYLEMPIESMPMYIDNNRWHVKGQELINFIMKGCVQGKWRNTLMIARIFPINTLKFFPSIFYHLNWMKIKERLFGE